MPRPRLPIVVLPLCLLAACTTTPSSTFNETAYGINRAPNSAARGSEEFCRIYAGQTTANQIESSDGDGGKSASGFDKFLAQREGGRAYERCRAGQTN